MPIYGAALVMLRNSRATANNIWPLMSSISQRHQHHRVKTQNSLRQFGCSLLVWVFDMHPSCRAQSRTTSAFGRHF